MLNKLQSNIKTRDTRIKLLEKTLNPYQCDKCDFKTNVKNLLQKHTKGEHQKCTICNLNNFNSKTLAIHIKEVHPDSQPVCIK